MSPTLLLCWYGLVILSLSCTAVLVRYADPLLLPPQLFVCPSLIMLISLTPSQKQGRNEDGILNEFDHIAVASVHAFLQVISCCCCSCLCVVAACIAIGRCLVGSPWFACCVCCLQVNTAALPTPAYLCPTVYPN
jgi:hypothetical protein